MLDTISQLVSFVVTVSLTVFVARRAKRTRSRAVAVACGTGASILLSVVNDFSFTYATADYDRSLELVLSRALVSAAIGIIVSSFATRPSSMKKS